MMIEAVICRGLQDASGLSVKKQAAKEKGNLQLQAQALLAQGFSFSDYLGTEPFWGTLNFYIGDEKINPEIYSEIVHADRTLTHADRQMAAPSVRWDTKFYDIKWHPDKSPENLFFLKGVLLLDQAEYPCCIYFPNPRGGAPTYHPSTIVEVIAPPISFGCKKSYGQKATLIFPDGSLVIKARAHPVNGRANVPMLPS